MSTREKAHALSLCERTLTWRHYGRHSKRCDSTDLALARAHAAGVQEERERCLRDVLLRLRKLEDEADENETDIFSEGYTEGIVRARLHVAKMRDEAAAPGEPPQ